MQQGSNALEKTLRTNKKYTDKLNYLGINSVEDLVLYFPRNYEDKITICQIAEVKPGETNNVKGKIKAIQNIHTKFGKKITKALFSDEISKIEIVWFNQSHIAKLIPINKEIILSGKVEEKFGKLTMISPIFEMAAPSGEQVHSGYLTPVYHETFGINSKWIRSKLKPIIDLWLKNFPEYLPSQIKTKYQLIDYQEALKIIHFPENQEELEKAKRRLGFDELFLLQLKVLQQKWRWQNNFSGKVNQINQHYDVITDCISKLPFELTQAQKRTLKEIIIDMQKELPMTRLVQGDVGSGKTVVAALAALLTAKNGHQVAIMAPTEILANQHYLTFIKVLKEYNLNIQILTGSTGKKQRQELLRQMKTGTLDVIIGTHALIQEGIGFRSLGLAIIDEQHRFGVEQRSKLKSTLETHLLSMTATPIPRTLAITIYGDQDLSVIDEMPKGRQKIITKVVPENKRIMAYRWIEDQIKKGRQAFIICPLIDESDTLEAKAVLQEYDYLKEHIFPDLQLGLLHGKLKSDDKDEIMARFKANEINILVSTSVIEVGIDIPNATIMLIEGAERFGLSQLHQFRGRVGRGDHQSYCFLFPGKASNESQKRLKAMEMHTSGFKLAEIDLEIRGPGEIYGLKQSGIPDLKIANLMDLKLIEEARQAAQELLEQDPELLNNPALKSRIEKLNQVYLKD